jgi:regulator of protease activity HflC (stomatin/prohibitin superfamily)
MPYPILKLIVFAFVAGVLLLFWYRKEIRQMNANASGTKTNAVYVSSTVRSQFFGLLETFRVKQHQVGFLEEEGDFQTILGPGEYQYFQYPKRKNIILFDIDTPEFTHPRLDYLLAKHPDLYQKHFVDVNLSQTQAALLSHNGVLKKVLAPGTRTRFWKGIVETQAEVIDLAEAVEIPPDLAKILKQLSSTSSIYTVETVGAFDKGVLIVDGAYQKTLEPGTYGFWKALKQIQILLVDMRVRPVEVSGQEILTKDKVTLRVNVTAQFQVTDPVKATQSLSNYNDFLYQSIQFAIRDAVGTQMMDDLLANKDAMNAMLLTSVNHAVQGYGLVVNAIGVKDVILPGEMRDIFNQVVEAEKAAQANLIKRREETAATRSLLNTAKLMEDNPTLLRLKELESLEKVTGKIQQLTVLSGVDGLMSQLVNLSGNKKG